MSSDRKKPIKLQVNTFGSAWHDVVRFDAADEVASVEVMDAAERLGRMCSFKRSRFRIIVEDIDAPIGAEPDVLTTWTLQDGWKAVAHA